MEIWNLITSEAKWSKLKIAETEEGVLVTPYHSTATKFSLVGGLLKCYLRPGRIWSYRYERRRSDCFNALMSVPELRAVIKELKYSSFKVIPLQELNTRVDFDFVSSVLTHMEERRISL